MLKTRNIVKLAVFLAAAVWLIMAYLLHLPVDSNWLGHIPSIASAVVFVWIGFDLYLWRWFPVAITRRPNLNGTWEGSMNSSWKDKDGKEFKGTCYLVMSQTFSQITLLVLLEGSRSVSTTADMAYVDGHYRLSYVYRSEAHVLNRKDNPPHRGAAELVVSLVPQLHLEGDYWTDRSSLGRIVAKKRSTLHYDTFDAARSGSYR